MNSAVGLRKLMERSGAKSQEAFAELLGYSRASSIQRYLSEEEFGDKPLPEGLIKKLLENVVGTGCPPITVPEILALGGISALTKSSEGRTIIAQNAAIVTGCYVPVLSIEDAMNLKPDDREQKTAKPIEYVYYDRELGDNECAIRIPDGSMAPKYPAGALAIVKLGKERQPGWLLFLRVSEDGQETGTIREYQLRGYTEEGAKVEKFLALNEAFPDYSPGEASGAPKIEVSGRVVRVIITIDC